MIAKNKQYNTKVIYFLDKLKKSFDKVLNYSLTIVEAPMGYGKTTAVKEYLCKKDVKILWQKVHGNSLKVFWKGFCEILSEIDESCSEKLIELGFPNDSISVKSALNIISNLKFFSPTIFVIEDYHIINNSDADNFIKALFREKILNLHIVITARFVSLEEIDELKAQGYINHITQENFEFNTDEIIQYYKLCGINLKKQEAKELYSFTEGWVSALYLIMINYLEEGRFDMGTNIYTLLEKAIYNQFSKEIKEFLLNVCIFDSFTLEQASYMVNKENTAELLKEIIKVNAFIKYDKESNTYQMHNIFTNTLKGLLKGSDINYLYSRAANWYLKIGDYETAIYHLYLCKDFEALLTAVEAYKVHSSYGGYERELIKYFEECPEDIKAKHPWAMLVYMLKLFSFNEMKLFGKNCIEFEKNIQMDETLSKEMKNTLLGEYELLMSFTVYNDIAKMIEHHKKAAKLLSEKSVLFDAKGSWTFGAPSVIYMFYRESGKLNEHVKAILEGIFYYQEITSGNGNGAEYVMEAEWYFSMGEYDKAEISAEEALKRARENVQQVGIIICAVFLQIRIEIMRADFTKVLGLLEKLKASIVEKRQNIFIPTVDICEGYVYAFLNQGDISDDKLINSAREKIFDKIPSWIKNEVKNNHISFPVEAMLNILQGRIILLKGDYLKLIGIAEYYINIAGVFPNLLGTIYTHIYMSAANEKIGRKKEAIKFLYKALDNAMPDKMYIPFVENCDFIKPMLEELQKKNIYCEEIAKILELYSIYSNSIKEIYNKHFTSVSPKLTGREIEIAEFAAAGLTNKEISEKLFISQNTVKTQLKNIYEKLNINSRNLLKQCLEKIK